MLAMPARNGSMPWAIGHPLRPSTGLDDQADPPLFLSELQLVDGPERIQGLKGTAPCRSPSGHATTKESLALDIVDRRLSRGKPSEDHPSPRGKQPEPSRRFAATSITIKAESLVATDHQVITTDRKATAHLDGPGLPQPEAGLSSSFQPGRSRSRRRPSRPP